VSPYRGPKQVHTQNGPTKKEVTTGKSFGKLTDALRIMIIVLVYRFGLSLISCIYTHLYS
jgi:hypothetical protein